MKLKAYYSRPQKPVCSPVVFVHGAWHSANCWSRYFQPYFAQKGIPSVAFSFRGHGESQQDFSQRWTRLDEYVHDLKSIVDDLDEPSVLIGHSMGGFVVQKYLQRYAARGAVLMAPAPRIGILPATIRMFMRHPGIFLRANLQMHPFQLVGCPRLADEYFYSNNNHNTPIEDNFQLIENESYMALINMMYQLPKRPQTSLPMLVVGGGRDNVFTPKEIKNTAEYYRADLKIFDQMPHNLMLDSQWKLVADFVLEWLNEKELVA